jgi:hypothetical protein
MRRDLRGGIEVHPRVIRQPLVESQLGHLLSRLGSQPVLRRRQHNCVIRNRQVLAA